jgi:hypothetical protein
MHFHYKRNSCVNKSWNHSPIPHSSRHFYSPFSHNCLSFSRRNSYTTQAFDFLANSYAVEVRLR